MSFLKKFSELSDDLGRLGLVPDKKSDQRKDEGQSSNRDGYQGYGGQTSSQPYPPQQSQGGYYPPPQDQPYSSPPPDAGPRPAPPYNPPADKPPIPSGWIPQWDDRSQRWYCRFAWFNAVVLLTLDSPLTPLCF